MTTTVELNLPDLKHITLHQLPKKGRKPMGLTRIVNCSGRNNFIGVGIDGKLYWNGADRGYHYSNSHTTLWIAAALLELQQISKEQYAQVAAARKQQTEREDRAHKARDMVESALALGIKLMPFQKDALEKVLLEASDVSVYTLLGEQPPPGKERKKPDDWLDED